VNQPATNTTTFAMISALMAGVIPPGPKEYDNPEGAG
jgi:hypothetical protein